MLDEIDICDEKSNHSNQSDSGFSWEYLEDNKSTCTENEFEFVDLSILSKKSDENSISLASLASKSHISAIDFNSDSRSIESEEITTTIQFKSLKYATTMSEDVKFELLCGEKAFRSFRGHTYRRNAIAYNLHREKSKISSKGGIAVTYDDGTREIGVSLIDQFFGHDFLAGLEYSINKEFRFSQVLELLEELAIKKQIVHNKAHSRIETRFCVPLVALQIFTPQVTSDSYSRMPLQAGEEVELQLEKRKKAEEDSFMIYCGKRYDTKYIYLFNPYGKTPLTIQCLLNPSSAMAEETNALMLDFRVLNLHHNQYRQCAHLNAHNIHRSNGWKQLSDDASLTIDLGSFRHVTHFVTAGQYPTLSRFPKRKYTGQPRTRKRWHWKRTADPESKDPFVHIVEQSHQLAWVTAFNVFYRSGKSKTWLFLGNFAGNVDPTSEKAQSLHQHFNRTGGLYTRYLRFQATGYVGSPIFRVAVYGNKEIEEASSKVTAGPTIDEEPTKEYVVSMPMFAGVRTKSPDGYYSMGGHERYWLDYRTKVKVKTQTVRDMKKEVENYKYDEDDFYDDYDSL